MSHINTICQYLQGDVGLRPVLEVRQQQVGVPVNKVDADQLLTARTAKLRGTLAESAPSSLHTRGVVLAVGQLTQGQQRWGNLTQLTAAERRARDYCQMRMMFVKQRNKRLCVCVCVCVCDKCVLLSLVSLGTDAGVSVQLVHTLSSILTAVLLAVIVV